MDKKKQEKIKKLLEREGVYEEDGFLCFHLSPIPNWYNMMDKVDMICPVCNNSKIKIEYPKELKKEPMERNIVDFYNILCTHRLIQCTCQKCKTKIKLID